MTDINTNNAVKGPCRIWVGTFGVTEPAQTNAALIQDPGTGWTFVGGSTGRTSWIVTETITKTRPAQVVDNMRGAMTARDITLTVNLLEDTLANLLLSLNAGTITAGSGISVYDPGQPNAGTPLTYSAILVDGFAPLLSGGGAARRRAIFRKCLNDAKVTQGGDPVNDEMIALNLTAFGVSSTISPFVVMDQTA